MTDAPRLRRATPDDVDFLVALANDGEVEPFMGTMTPRNREAVLDELARAEAAPDELGWYVVEAEHDGRWEQAGAVAFEVAHRRSRVAQLHRLMLLPQFRGHGIGREAARLFARHLIRELGYHRVQLECYGFNERAVRLFESAGFVREGLKRKVYWRHDAWQDAVVFGVVEEDFDHRRPPG